VTLFEIGILIVISGTAIAFFLRRPADQPHDALAGTILVNELLIKNLVHTQDETLKRLEQSVEVLDLTVTRLIKTVEDQNQIYNTQQWRMKEMLGDDLLEVE